MFLDYYLICCVQNGICQFYETSLKESEKSNGYTVYPGESFLMKPGKQYSYRSTSDEQWINAWIGFNGTRAAEYLAMTDFAEKPVIKTGTEIYEELRKLTDQNFDQKNPTVRFMNASAILWRIFSHLTDISHTACDQVYRSSYSDRAVAFIHNNYFFNISVSDIAAALNITREYLYTLFKKDIGKSPSQYLLDLRIEKACVLLQESDYPIARIAQHIGFYDHAYFTKTFRARLGISPRQYREQNIQSKN